MSEVHEKLNAKQLTESLREALRERFEDWQNSTFKNQLAEKLREELAGVELRTLTDVVNALLGTLKVDWERRADFIPHDAVPFSKGVYILVLPNAVTDMWTYDIPEGETLKLNFILCASNSAPDLLVVTLESPNGTKVFPSETGYLAAADFSAGGISYTLNPPLKIDGGKTLYVKVQNLNLTTTYHCYVFAGGWLE